MENEIRFAHVLIKKDNDTIVDSGIVYLNNIRHYQNQEYSISEIMFLSQNADSQGMTRIQWVNTNDVKMV